MNGKGDSPRPMSVTADTFETNWEHTFGKVQRLKTEILEDRYRHASQSPDFLTQYPGLTGKWEVDKLRWEIIQTRRGLDIARVRANT
jgi:hypothetical protein